MRKIVLGIVIGACVLGLAWYGWLFYISKDARKFDSANVFVTFHDTPTQCGLTLRGSSVEQPVLCGDVGSYIHDQLRLAAGATFGASDMGNTHGPEIAALASQLESAGYRSVGTIRISFITEPEPPAGNR
jgi:hypothetical protein